LRELHPTGEKLVWRDPGDLEPVYDFLTITSEIPLPQFVTHTVTYAPRGTLKRKEPYKMLQNTNKKSLVEGLTKSQKRKDSEAKEALQSGKGYRITKKKKLDR